MMRKNGNKSEIGDDFTAHNIANADTCTNVKMCIFHVGTRRTNGEVP